MLSSPATVLTRVLAKATRDKRANNIFYCCGGLRRVGKDGKESGKKGGRRTSGLNTWPTSRTPTGHPVRFSTTVRPAPPCTPRPLTTAHMNVYVRDSTRAGMSYNPGPIGLPLGRPLGQADWSTYGRKFRSEAGHRRNWGDM